MKIETEKDSDLHLRINANDYLLLKTLSASCGKSVSTYVRMLIDNAILPYKQMILKGDMTYEDFKTLFDHYVQQSKFFRN